MVVRIAGRSSRWCEASTSVRKFGCSQSFFHLAAAASILLEIDSSVYLSSSNGLSPRSLQ
jgi:hypothetical protein